MTINEALALYNANLLKSSELQMTVDFVNMGSDCRFYTVKYCQVTGKATIK